MQEDERDRLEVLIFDEIEETVGTWLRAIIQRLEKEHTAIRRDHHKQPTPSGETLTAMPLHEKCHPKSAKPARLTVLDRRRQVLPIAGRSGFANSREGVTPILPLIPRILRAQSSGPGPATSCNGLFKFPGIRLDRDLCDERSLTCPFRGSATSIRCREGYRYGFTRVHWFSKAS